MATATLTGCPEAEITFDAIPEQYRNENDLCKNPPNGTKLVEVFVVAPSVDEPRAREHYETGRYIVETEDWFETTQYYADWADASQLDIDWRRGVSSYLLVDEQKTIRTLCGHGLGLED